MINSSVKNKRKKKDKKKIKAIPGSDLFRVLSFPGNVKQNCPHFDSRVKIQPPSKTDIIA